MKINSKKIIGVSLAILVVLVTFSLKSSLAVPTSTTKTTKEQKAIQEVINAYYNRGNNVQYCEYRKSYNFAPEDATSQNTMYSVCSHFTYSVYKQAFNMDILTKTAQLMGYAKKYYDPNNKTNDVIEYWHRTKDSNGKYVFKDEAGNIKSIDLKSSNDTREKYGNELLTKYNLQIGDILVYRSGSEDSYKSEDAHGHTVIVYDILYDENGKPYNAVLRESMSNYDKETTKISIGLSNANIYNKINKINEGTFQEFYLMKSYNRNPTADVRTSLVWNISTADYFAIIRPLLKNSDGTYTGYYYYTDMGNNYNCTNTTNCFAGIKGRTLKSYSITNDTNTRINYSSIYIEKTVDVGNNSIVGLDDYLTYKIIVKNNSNKAYNNFEVIENISDLVEIKDNNNGTQSGNQLKWIVSSLNAGKTFEINYKVKVKHNINNIGKTITSTGTVAGISSSKINTQIYTKPTTSEKNKIKELAQNYISNKQYKELSLINNIYANSIGQVLDLSGLSFEDLIKTLNGTQYNSDNLKSTIYLNNNEYSKYILSNYYGALYTNPKDGKVQIKMWENTSPLIPGRSERRDTIYKQNFQTGDILVYKNSQTPTDNKKYQTEDGTYYLIYISDEDSINVNGTKLSGFIGLDKDGNIKNISTSSEDLKSILGKDYYAIFRPIIKQATERENNKTVVTEETTEQKTTDISNNTTSNNQENKKTSKSQNSKEDNQNTNDEIQSSNEEQDSNNKTNKKSSNKYIVIIALVVGIIAIPVSILIYIKLKKQKVDINNKG